MTPLASTCLSSPIKVDCTDKEIILFLRGRRSGDPLPSNVITEVNPFTVEPWNTPDSMLYLCNSEETVSPKGEKGIKNASSGYWKDMGSDLEIFTDTHTVGRKVTWEFFRGAAPSGHESGWMMFEYKLEQKELQATDKDFNKLYRVFWHNKDMTAFEEPQNPVSLDDADGDYIQSVLLSMLEQEEANINLLEPAEGSQGLTAVLNRILEDSKPNNSDESYPACDFSSGDFLELNDLYDPESSSFSSENSSCASRSSDEYFDSEAFLRDLENEHKLSIEGQRAEYKFSVSTSVSTSRVVIQPPSQGSVRAGVADVIMTGEISAASAPSRGPQVVGSSSVLPLHRNDGAFRYYRDNEEIDYNPQLGGTSRGSVTNRVGRIAKLGKKYFCFVSH